MSESLPKKQQYDVNLDEIGRVGRGLEYDDSTEIDGASMGVEDTDWFTGNANFVMDDRGGFQQEENIWNFDDNNGGGKVVGNKEQTGVSEGVDLSEGFKKKVFNVATVGLKSEKEPVQEFGNWRVVEFSRKADETDEEFAKRDDKRQMRKMLAAFEHGGEILAVPDVKAENRDALRETISDIRDMDDKEFDSRVAEVVEKVPTDYEKVGAEKIYDRLKGNTEALRLIFASVPEAWKDKPGATGEADEETQKQLSMVAIDAYMDKFKNVVDSRENQREYVKAVYEKKKDGTGKGEDGFDYVKDFEGNKGEYLEAFDYLNSALYGEQEEYLYHAEKLREMSKKEPAKRKTSNVIVRAKAKPVKSNDSVRGGSTGALGRVNSKNVETEGESRLKKDVAGFEEDIVRGKGDEEWNVGKAELEERRREIVDRIHEAGNNAQKRGEAVAELGRFDRELLDRGIKIDKSTSGLNAERVERKEKKDVPTAIQNIANNTYRQQKNEVRSKGETTGSVHEFRIPTEISEPKVEEIAEAEVEEVVKDDTNEVEGKVEKNNEIGFSKISEGEIEAIKERIVNECAEAFNAVPYVAFNGNSYTSSLSMLEKVEAMEPRFKIVNKDGSVDVFTRFFFPSEQGGETGLMFHLKNNEGEK